MNDYLMGCAEELKKTFFTFSTDDWSGFKLGDKINIPGVDDRECFFIGTENHEGERCMWYYTEYEPRFSKLKNRNIVPYSLNTAEKMKKLIAVNQ